LLDQGVNKVLISADTRDLLVATEQVNQSECTQEVRISTGIPKSYMLISKTTARLDRCWRSNLSHEGFALFGFLLMKYLQPCSIHGKRSAVGGRRCRLRRQHMASRARYTHLELFVTSLSCRSHKLRVIYHHSLRKCIDISICITAKSRHRYIRLLELTSHMQVNVIALLWM
jgi:hypothetical protein